MVAKKAESVAHSFVKSVLFNSAALSESLVRVLNYSIFKREYSQFRNLQFTFKNVS